MAAARASGGGFGTAVSKPQPKMLEGAVEEPVEETSRLFEAARLEASSLDAPQLISTATDQQVNR